MDDTHPPRDSPVWDRPDYCPFCGTALADGGAGFVDHLAEADACAARFEAWREQVADDIGGEWGGCLRVATPRRRVAGGDAVREGGVIAGV